MSRGTADDIDGLPFAGVDHRREIARDPETTAFELDCQFWAPVLLRAVLIGLWFPMFNYNLFGGPLFEEFGWRGFLQVHLQQIMPPWVAAICVGVMWALWHTPLFLVSWSSSSVSIYVLIVTGLSNLMACAFNSSGRAVVVAIIMHSAFNASSRFIDPFLDGTPTRKALPRRCLLPLCF